MSQAAVPPTEASRLAALRESGILDTPPEQHFEQLAQLAAAACHAPIALVSFVDRDRQWFKAMVGFTERETPRAISFCAHAILKDDLMVVKDARLDERFRDNPLVTGTIGIRMYAGAPIVTNDGHALGTVCVIDRSPRKPTEKERDLLRFLAGCATTEIEFRRTLRRLAIEMKARERADDTRERSMARLREAYRDLESFTYSASHDLRAPLRRLDIVSRRLEEDHAAAMAPEPRALVHAIRTESTRMSELVRDFLRLASAQRDLARATVDVTRLAREIIARLEREEPHRHVNAWVQDDLLADADEPLVRILLENLLGNAWKYTRGTPDCEIMVGAQTMETGETAFFVGDNGPGFDPAHAERLFEPFQRIHDDPSVEGTGLGLAIVARIAARHGGRAWATSEPGEGSTFWFTLGA